MKPYHNYRPAAPLCLFLAMLFTPALHAAEPSSSDSLPTTAASFMTTFENITLPQGEKMGMLGGTYLYNISEHVSLGPAVYGAVTGQRGGFITLGGSAEYMHPLGADYLFDGGLFVGAGGGRGGYQLSGGGLMLRYHAGISYQTDHYGRFGVGMSYVDFPDGTIHSSQTYLAYDYPFRMLIASGWRSADATSGGITATAEHELAAIYKRYTVPSGVLAENGTAQHSRIDLVGMEWNKYLSDNLFMHTEAEGAMGGESNGYMQILLGIGYRYPLYDSGAIKLSGSAGVAGGGNAATGGGLLLDTQLSFQQELSKHTYLEATGGYVYAPDGDFRAQSLALKLGYTFDMPFVGEDILDFDTSALSGFNIHHFRIRAAHQSYLKAAPDWRTHHNDYNIDNLGIQIDAFLDEHLFLTGQGMAAYSGKAGAYMAGLLGAGLHYPIGDSSLFFDGELLAGAAGGGGVSVGGGFVWQTNLGAGYQINDNFSLLTQYGRMEAPQGSFKANVVTLSVGYNFSLFMR